MCDCEQPAANYLPLRIIGSITLVFSIIQVIFDVMVFVSLTAPRVGAWWAAGVILIASALGIISTKRGIVIAAMIFGNIGVIIGVIGCAVDGIASSIVSSLAACISDFGVCSGDSNYCDEANEYCHYFVFTAHDCYCIDKSKTQCYFYNGGGTENGPTGCNVLFNQYSDYLHVAFAFDVLATLGAVALSIAACVSVFCPTLTVGTSYGRQPVPQSEVAMTVTNQKHQPAQTQAEISQQQLIVVQGVVINGPKC